MFSLKGDRILRIPLDAARISELLVALSEEFIVPEFPAAGRQRLLEEFSAAALQARLAGPFRFYLAEQGNTLAGVAAVREPDHLYLLFVAKAHHRTGLARALWTRVPRDYLSDPDGLQRMTVKASNFAVPAYQRLGFMRRSGPPLVSMGVTANPMEFRVERAR